MSNFKRFSFSLQIKEHHLDTFGHVNNATYLQLMEEARWELLHDQGLDLKTMHERQEAPVVLECHIKFLQEIGLREAIAIESQVLSYEKKIGTMQQTIRNNKGDVCAQAQFTFGLFDLKHRKLMLPTTQWLELIGRPVSCASD